MTAMVFQSQVIRAKRSGFSLIEMVTVIVITAILLGTVVTLLASLLGQQSTIHQRAIRRSEINRLSDVLRNDLRRAISLSRPKDNTLSIVSPTGTAVRYTLGYGLCQRQESTTGQGRAQLDSFHIGMTTTWQVSPPDLDAGLSITVVIQRPPAVESKLPAVPIRIVAVQQNATSLE